MAFPKKANIDVNCYLSAKFYVIESYIPNIPRLQNQIPANFAFPERQITKINHVHLFDKSKINQKEIINQK